MRRTMAIVIGLLYTLVYLLLAGFLAVLGVHGPRLFPYFVLGFLVVTLSVRWWLCFYIPRHKPKHAAARLGVCGVGLGAFLVLASYATWHPLENWEEHQVQ